MPRETIRRHFTILAAQKFLEVSTLASSITPNAPNESEQRGLVRDALSTAMSYAYMAEKYDEYEMSENDKQVLDNEAKHQEELMRQSEVLSALTQKMPLQDLADLLAAPKESMSHRGYLRTYQDRLNSFFLESSNLTVCAQYMLKDGLDHILLKNDAGVPQWNGSSSRPWGRERANVFENTALVSAFMSVQDQLRQDANSIKNARELLLEVGKQREKFKNSAEYELLRKYVKPNEFIYFMAEEVEVGDRTVFQPELPDTFMSSIHSTASYWKKKEAQDKAELEELAKRRQQEREAEAKRRAMEEAPKPPTEREWLRDYLDNSIAHAAADFAQSADADDWSELDVDNEGAIQTIADITAAYQMLQNAGDEIVTDTDALHRRVNDRAWEIHAQSEYRALLENTTPKDFKEMLVADAEDFAWRSAEDVMSRMGVLLAEKNPAPQPEKEPEPQAEKEPQPEQEPEPQPQPEPEEPYHELTDEEIDKLSPEETARMLRSELLSVARLMEQNGNKLLTDRAEYAAMYFEKSLRPIEGGFHLREADRITDNLVNLLNKEPELASLVEKNHLLGGNYQKLLWNRVEQVGVAQFMNKIPPKKDEPQLTDEQLAACDRDTMRARLGREFDDLARALKEQGSPEWESAVSVRRSIRRHGMTGEDFKGALDYANEVLSAPLGETGETIGDFARKNGMMGAYFDKLMNRAGEIADVWAKEKAEEEPEVDRREPEPEKAPQEPEQAPEQAPEAPAKWLDSLKTVTNTRDYIERLQQKMKELPAQNPKQADKRQLGLAAAAIFAARTAINAKAGSFRGSALNTPRQFEDEGRLVTEIGGSETFRKYISKMPYEKLRSLILTGHGGEMEKSFRGFVAKGDKLPENLPERLMPTAKERCEALQKKLQDAKKPEDKENLFGELIATRQAVEAKTGGENLDKKPKAEVVNRKLAENKDDPALGKLLKKAANDPKAQALALKGHGGKFTERMLDVAKQRSAPAQEKAQEKTQN